MAIEYSFQIGRGDITIGAMPSGAEEAPLLRYIPEKNVYEPLELPTSGVRESKDAIVIFHQERNDSTLLLLQNALCSLGEVCRQEIEKNPSYGVARAWHSYENKEGDLYGLQTVGAVLTPL
jgi:hypothetical protein